MTRPLKHEVESAWISSRPRRARHLVLLRPLAAQHARLAGEDAEQLDYYYPTSVLITSRDIITLWVARMVLTGLYNVGEVPFHEVFIHPKILDGYGETMTQVEGERRRSARHHRQVRRRRAALRPGPSHDRNARRADAGGVRVPALPGADRPDEEEPRAAAKSIARSAARSSPRSGLAPSRQGPAARRRGQRAVRGRPQLHEQALERLPVRADQLGGLGSPQARSPISRV